LLKDALKRAANASKEIGARRYRSCLGRRSGWIYLQYKFKSFPTDPRTLYMPIANIVDAL